MTIIRSTNIVKYMGYNLISKCSCKNPNKGGMRVVPRYAEAICTPIMECETSLPKLVGVECIKLGYIGAQPKPMRIRPINAV